MLKTLCVQGPCLVTLMWQLNTFYPCHCIQIQELPSYGTGFLVWLVMGTYLTGVVWCVSVDEDARKHIVSYAYAWWSPCKCRWHVWQYSCGNSTHVTHVTVTQRLPTMCRIFELAPPTQSWYPRGTQLRKEISDLVHVLGTHRCTCVLWCGGVDAESSIVYCVLCLLDTSSG